MQFKIRLDGKAELGMYFAAKPAQIQRAARFTANEYTRIVHKEAGSEIPRVVASSVLGFKRVRAKRRLAKARAKRVQGITWIGENEIAGIYAKGRLKKVKGGVMKGRYFFENAFVATMKSGHTGIFTRLSSGKIKQATFPIEAQADGVIRDVVRSNEPKIQAMLRRRLERELSRKK